MAAALGLGASVVLLGLWACGYGLGIAPFAPFDFADAVILAAPGAFATWGIETFGHAAAPLLQTAGVAIVAVLGALFGLALRSRATPLAGALLALVLLPVTLALAWQASGGLSAGRAVWLCLFFAATLAAGGALAGRWLERLALETPAPSTGDWLEQPGDYGRRELLRNATALTLLLGGGGGLLGWLLRSQGVAEVATAAGDPLEVVRADPTLSATPLPTPVPAPPLVEDFDAPLGVRPPRTDNDEFYVVDISTRDPRIDQRGWTLRVHGLVERELTLTYADLLAMPAIEQDATLRCISFTYGSGLISTTRWTGVRLRDVLQRAGVQDGAVDVVLHGAGGYSDSIPLAKALEQTTLLVYGMNGDALPRRHGFPCRLYVANLYGEKNVKWLQRIELVDYDYTGFWQERGWSEEAIVNILSMIDTPTQTTTPDPNGVVPVGGVAFAGSRGISAVQLRIDDGDWLDAVVEPYQPALVWQRWRYDWRASPGKHTLTVRAVDGAGMPQIAEERPPHPDGVTGLETVTTRVAG